MCALRLGTAPKVKRSRKGLHPLRNTRSSEASRPWQKLCFWYALLWGWSAEPWLCWSIGICKVDLDFEPNACKTRHEHADRKQTCQQENHEGPTWFFLTFLTNIRIGPGLYPAVDRGEKLPWLAQEWAARSRKTTLQRTRWLLVRTLDVLMGIFPLMNSKRFMKRIMDKK